MKRIINVIAVCAALFVCLMGAGCAGSTGSSDNAITVTADGTAQIVADSASFNIKVVARGDDQNQARLAITNACSTIIAAAKEAGLSDQNISKTDGGLTEVWGTYGEEQVMGGYWDWDGNWIETGWETIYYDRSNEIVAYDATTTIEVRDLAASKIADLIKQSKAVGAASFSDLHFVVADREGAYKKALGAAVDAAHAKAQTLASASGVYVGRVVNMVENSDSQEINLKVPGDTALLDAQNAEALVASIPNVAVQASVTVSYAIS